MVMFKFEGTASLQGDELLGDADADGNPLTESPWNGHELYPEDTSPVGWRVLERMSEAEASMLRQVLSARDLIVDDNGVSLLVVSIAKVLLLSAPAALRQIARAGSCGQLHSC